jgi:hypothetical protein
MNHHNLVFSQNARNPPQYSQTKHKAGPRISQRISMPPVNLLGRPPPHLHELVQVLSNSRGYVAK